jgi:hypothetical protein
MLGGSMTIWSALKVYYGTITTVPTVLYKTIPGLVSDIRLTLIDDADEQIIPDCTSQSMPVSAT